METCCSAELERLAKLAYAAGYFDGEGSIWMSKGANVRSYTLTLTVCTGDKDSISVFPAIFGGNVHPVKHKTSRVPTWRWLAQGMKAVEVLKRLEPLLIAKQDQARLVLDSGYHQRRTTRVDESQRMIRDKLNADLRAAKTKNRIPGSENFNRLDDVPS